MKPEVEKTFSFTGSEERISKLINSLHVGILIEGPEAEILFANNAALTILGLTRDEIYGTQKFYEQWNVIHEDGSLFSKECSPVAKAIATKKPVDDIIMGIKKPESGNRLWISMNAEPLIDSNGEIKEIIISFSDISKAKAAEEKLTWLYQSLEVRAFELATTNADLERFVYVATHDLQEPLRLVSSFTQLLKKKYETQLDQQALEYINYAVEGASRMKKLILGLLEFSKFSSNRDTFSETDMNKVLEQACNTFSKEIQDSEAKLIIPPLPVIKANKAMMVQLFENLISNALTYKSEKKPVIQIACSEEEDKYLFSITDNGIGIDANYSHKIFILFQRLHSDNDNYEGMGAGLAICKKIAELHRGTIWVVSEKEKGSTFYFTIGKKNQTYEKI